MLDDKDRENMEGQHIEPSAEAEQQESVIAAAPAEPVGGPAPADPVMELPEIPAVAVPSEPVLLMQAEQQPRRTSRFGWKLFAAAVALVAMGAGVGSATTWTLASKFQQSSVPIGFTGAQTSASKTVAQSIAEGGQSVIPGIYKRVSPSVVAISVYTQKGLSRGQATGSGFVVDSRGYILTNFHVVDGGQQITVKFVDGTKLDAKVVGSDRFQDMALLKVDPGNRSLVASSLGDSDAVEVGELAVAIGTPFQQEFTVTAGIVSAVNREVEEENNPFKIPGAIQTDAAINPGNSGGPLLDGNGQVVGINTLIETGNSGVRGNIGIGFAIPINAAKAILPALMNGEKVQYPWIGVELGDLTADLANQLGVSVKKGAVISRVFPNSPAEKGGLKDAAVNRRGDLLYADVVTAIDGQPIADADALIKYVRSHKVGDKLTLTVVRGKDTLTLPLTLDARPENLDQQQ